MRGVLFALCCLFSSTAIAGEFVGSETCQSCHAAEYTQWQSSHHHDAMLPASEDSIKGNFDAASYEHFGVTTRFFRRDREFLVNTEDGEGARQDFVVRYTFGVDPLQQYLVEMPGGRLQALSVAWDSRAKADGGQRWFHLYPDEAVPAADVLHWTRHYHNWNLRCAECHSTGLEKNYSAATNSYDARWIEVNVGCEACHGPASEHLAWAGSDAVAERSNDKGLAVDIAKHSRWVVGGEATAELEGQAGNATQLDVCAPCHSRRSVVEQPAVGDAFLDKYRLALLTPELYHADGQILDEVYVYGSFLQSKMFAEGVVCTDCHNPHNAEVYSPDNQLCTRCHQPAVFDIPKHHHHATTSAGAQCVNCHMPETTYMEVDPRRDHSLRIPNPAVTAATGAPNACSGCHQDRDLDWALEAYSERHGDIPVTRQAAAFHSAGQGSAGSARELVGVAMDMALPVIVRASALELLQDFPGQETVSVAAQLVYDDEPLLRMAAVRLFEMLPPEQRIPVLDPLLDDDYASVRAEAARLIAAVPPLGLNESQRAIVARAETLYLESQLYNLDAPGVHLNFGVNHSQRQDLDRAEKSYLQALRLDDRFLPALLNLADLYRAKGEDWRVRPLLSKALKIEPAYADAHYAMGLLLVRQKRYEQALEYLAEAARLQPSQSQYSYVYAVALNSNGRSAEAVKVLENAVSHRPEDVQLLVSLAQFLHEQGQRGDAAKVVAKLQLIAPRDRRVQQLRGLIRPNH
ncbi:MAG: tetratricopeptide (TPR) repeat protein [Halieaceae bacterium]